MKLSIKKTIAREFLILITLILFSVLCGICIYPYNVFLKSQITSIEKEISFQSKQSANLSSVFRKKRLTQETFIKALTLEYNISETDENTTEKTWKVLEERYTSDSIPIFYKKWDKKVVEFLKSRGFNEGKGFEKFVGENILNKNDSINYLKSKKVDQSISELKIQSNHFKDKILSSKEQMNFSFLIFIILMLVAFPLRYLIWGIKWSIKTIKQNE
jgi:hypothetical protein